MYPAGAKFAIGQLGTPGMPEPFEEGISTRAWDLVNNAPELEDEQPSAEVLALMDQRQQARVSKQWAESDRLREQISALGWTVQDTKDGQKLVKS
jgi:cysteinyl-tRNA synthetase